MLMWECTSEGYWECVADHCAGIVGLTPQRTGWTAQVVGPDGLRAAPQLYHTSQEAKLWVEQQIQAQALAGIPEAAQARWSIWRGPRRRPASERAVRSWGQAVLHAIRRHVADYLHWNAILLNPQQYGQVPLCFAAAQHALRQQHRKTGAAACAGCR